MKRQRDDDARDIVEVLQHHVNNNCSRENRIQLHLLQHQSFVASRNEIDNALPSPLDDTDRGLFNKRLGEASVFGAVYELPDDWHFTGRSVVKLFGRPIKGSKPTSYTIDGSQATSKSDPVYAEPELDRRGIPRIVSDAQAFVREVTAMRELNEKLHHTGLFLRSAPFSGMLDYGYWLWYSYDHHGNTIWYAQYAIVYKRVDGMTLHRLFKSKFSRVIGGVSQTILEKDRISGKTWWNGTTQTWVSAERDVIHFPCTVAWFILRVALDMCVPMETLRMAGSYTVAGEGVKRMRPIAHMDIKPDNIMVGPEGLTLIDLGISVFISPSMLLEQETYDSVYPSRLPIVYANTWCKAPELYVNPTGTHYSLQTDMYIWGSMLLDMWSYEYNEVPWVQSNDSATLEQAFRKYGIFQVGILAESAPDAEYVVSASTPDSQLMHIPSSERAKGFASASAYCLDSWLTSGMLLAAERRWNTARGSSDEYAAEQTYRANELVAKLVTMLRRPDPFLRIRPKDVRRMIEEFTSDPANGGYRTAMLTQAFVT